MLAHDPEALGERSPLYNGIMFGAKGLPRADRELGAVAASRINGCAYCASVHAKRFTELTKAPEVMERIQADGVEAALDPRRKAILDYAAKLTRDPAAIAPADAAPLRAQGLSDLEILDLTHAVAMFAWANRLMQTLGEPAAPARRGKSAVTPVVFLHGIGGGGALVRAADRELRGRRLSAGRARPAGLRRRARRSRR